MLLKVLFIFSFLFQYNVPALALEEFPAEIEDKKIDTIETDSRSRFYAFANYMSASNSTTGGSFSGPGIGFMLSYAVSEKWSLGGGLQQSFTTIGAASTSTAINVQATYALSGSLMSKRKKTFLNGVKVFDKKLQSKGGFRLHVGSSQYYFNGSTSSVTFSGLGVGSSYEFSTDHGYDYITGVRLDQVSNNETTITPISVFVGIGFWF